MYINMTCPISCGIGYGIASQNIIKSLIGLNHNISLWPIGGIEVCQEDIPIFQQCINNVAQYDVSAPCVRIYHQFSLDQFSGKGLHIGFPIFETTLFTDISLHHMSCCDKLFVCSSWGKQIIENSLPGLKIDIVPLGYDPKIFYPENKYGIVEDNNDDKPYVFLNIGKWEIRKLHDMLPDIFAKAFTKDDNVELWMLSHNPFLNEEETNSWINLYKNSPLGNKIVVLDRVSTPYEVAGICRQANAGIFLSRGEGWGLGLLEMMASAKPCITTNYAGHTQFTSKDDTFLVDITETETAFDNRWFKGDVGDWAKIGDKEIEQCVEYLRFMYKNRPSGENALKQAQKFTWENSAKALISGLTF